MFIFDDIEEFAECDFIWEHRVGTFSDSGIAVLKVYEYLKVSGVYPFFERESAFHPDK